jgi:hypothetical protein
MQATLAVVPTLGTYYGLHSQHLQPDAFSAALCGGSAGLVMGTITALQRRQVFPEASEELRFLQPVGHTLLKATIGYACAFTVYEGLTRGITKARWASEPLPPPPSVILADWSWHLSNFFAGGISGLAFRAATLPLYRGLYENPLLTPRGAPLLGATFLQMGLAMAAGSAAKLGWQIVSQRSSPRHDNE